MDNCKGTGGNNCLQKVYTTDCGFWKSFLCLIKAVFGRVFTIRVVEKMWINSGGWGFLCGFEVAEILSHFAGLGNFRSVAPWPEHVGELA
jgi:hypothetical protein